MPRITVHTVATAPEASQPIARKLEQKMGKLLNINSDATWQAALDAGWSAEELSEAFAHIAANLFTNYFNHYAGTELDLPAVPELTA